MTNCVCPDDGQKIPSVRRIMVLMPDTPKGRGKAYIFDKDCPVHGYEVIQNEGE